MNKLSSAFRFAVAVVVAGIAAPTFANTMSVPSEEHPAYTVDVPSNWTPKLDKEDESLSATAPDNHVYISGWIVTKSDIGELTKDVEDLLKDSMKSIDEGTKEETIKNNGIEFKVLKGSGVDKREGGKVKFMVAVFPAGSGKAGIFYADYDADAPADATQTLNTILNSIKLKG
jgi:hypothetical protein